MNAFESYEIPIPRIDPQELTGWLIVVEGTDRVGRTTQIDRLRSHLRAAGLRGGREAVSRSDRQPRHPARKQGNTLGTNASSLHATDFADRSRASFPRCAPGS